MPRIPLRTLMPGSRRLATKLACCALVPVFVNGCSNPASRPNTAPLTQASTGLGKARYDTAGSMRDPLVAARTPRYTRVGQPPDPVTKVVALAISGKGGVFGLFIEARYPNVSSLETCKTELPRILSKPKPGHQTASYCIAYGAGRQAYVLKIE